MRNIVLLLSMVFIMLTGIVACSINNYNPTAFEYEYQKEAGLNIKRIIIAPENMGRPSRHYLKEHEEAVDLLVKEYLVEHNLEIVPDKIFKSIWRKTSANHGDLYDPSTGRVTAAYQRAITETLQKLFETNKDIDAVLFTNLLEQKVMYSNATKKVAMWSGVKRKLKTQGIGNSVSADFDWAETVDGITLEAWLFNRRQELILHNMGGIQIAQALEIHNRQGEFRRRDDLLENKKEIAEAIRIAMHPFIFMKHFPQKNTDH